MLPGVVKIPPPVVDESKTSGQAGTLQTEYYTVKKGDSYWKIARKFGSSSPELMRLNNTSSTLIKPGQKILVPKK